MATLVVAGCTVKVNVCVASVPTPLRAVSESVNLPAASGVPEMVTVPSSWGEKVSPAGSAPVVASTGVGVPVAVTVNENGTCTVPFALSALVNIGGSPTDSASGSDVLARNLAFPE